MDVVPSPVHSTDGRVTATQAALVHGIGNRTGKAWEAKHTVAACATVFEAVIETRLKFRWGIWAWLSCHWHD